MVKNTKREPKIGQSSRKQDIRTKHAPSGKEVRAKEDPSSSDHHTPAWQFHRCDEEHELWGWDKLTPELRLDIIKRHLCSFETMSWNEIKSTSGGKAPGNGTNSHALPIGGFSKKAISRLEELKLDDNDELFSLRLQGKLRLYGIKDGRVLRFIWHDPHHGSEDGAYPLKKR